MIFECINKAGKRKEKWLGRIIYIKNYGSHFELFIQSRSSILVLYIKILFQFANSYKMLYNIFTKNIDILYHISTDSANI